MKTVGLQEQFNISTKNGKIICRWQWRLHRYWEDWGSINCFTWLTLATCIFRWNLIRTFHCFCLWKHFFLNAKNAFLTHPVHFVNAQSNSCMKTVGLQGQFNISKKKKKNGKIKSSVRWWQWGLHRYQGDWGSRNCFTWLTLATCIFCWNLITTFHCFCYMKTVLPECKKCLFN